MACLMLLKVMGPVCPPIDTGWFRQRRRVGVMETKCESVRENLEDYCEGRLDRQVQTAVEQHLHYCEDCILRWALLRVETDDRLCNV
jgi:hypothetical protein